MAFSFIVDECNLNSTRLICDKCGYKSFAFPRGCKKSIRDAKKDLDVHICKPVEVTPKPTDESLNHRDYYGGDSPYEALKIIFHYNLGFCLGNALKYIIRAGKKDPLKEIEDLKKAQVYLQREIEYLQSQGGCSC